MKKLLLVLLFLLLNISLGFGIHSWTDPTDCKAPIRIIPLFFILFFLPPIAFYYFQSPFPRSYRKWLIDLDDFLIYPMLILLIVQGIRWGIKTGISQKCQNGEVLYGIGIIIICAFGLLLTVDQVVSLYDWWLYRQFREQRQNDPVFNQFILILTSFNGDVERENQFLRQIEAFWVKRRLFPKDLKKLKKRKFSQPNGKILREACSICYEDYVTGDEIVSLPKCKHAFHWECGTKWLLRSPFCPLCRNNVRRALYNVKLRFLQN